jgi:hypothetical protein
MVAGLKAIEKKTGEKFIIISHNALLGFLRGGTYTLSNIKTKKITQVVGNKFNKKYEIIS